MDSSHKEATHEHIDKDGFRLRGTALARIDAFSDVVFGFALTLLVVSLEVPKTYTDLHASLRGFIPFGLCFLLLMLIWFSHYKFFRRFGTHDLGTIAINALLLFVVLFYVYPLKFLFTFFVFWMMGMQTGSFESNQQVRELMVIYGLGFLTIYVLLGSLYWNARRQRQALHLNALELILTRSYMERMFGTALVGLISCVAAVALPVQYAGWAGMLYMLISPVHSLVRWKTGRKRKLAGLMPGIATSAV